MPHADRLYEIQTRLLYGPGTWFEECHEAVAGGSRQAASLVGRLAPGQNVHRALSLQATWPGRSRLKAEGSAEEGPGLSAARAAAAVVEVLSGAPGPEGRLRQAVAHWRRARVLTDFRLTGAEIATDTPDENTAAALRRLAVLADEAPEDSAACAFGALLVRALSDSFPRPRRSTELPVLFDRRTTGGHGVLRLELMDEGPMGLYPDPRTMMFLVADRPFAEALHVAWQIVPQRLAGACVVWRLSTEEQPCDQVGGGSLGAAFGVALAELARPLAKLRPRRLDRHCAVTAGLTLDKRLVEVSGTRNKLEQAVRRGLRVILAPPSPVVLPDEELLREAAVRFAADLPAAIRLTRSQVNRTFVTLMAAVLVAASGLVGGLMYAERRAALDREQAVGTRLVGAAATVAREDPASGLLLRALAARLGGAGARAALVGDLLTNRYEGTLLAGSRLCNEQQAWSPDGKVVATANDTSLTLWNVRSRRPIRTIRTPKAITDCAFSPNGSSLAIAAGDDLMLVALRSAAADPTRVIEGDVQTLRYARSGLLATAGSEHRIRLWSPTAQRSPRLLSTVTVTANTHSSGEQWLAFSPDSRTLAVPDGSGITLIDTARPESTRRVSSIPGPAECAAFSPDARILAVGTSDGVTELWDVRTPAGPRRRARTSPRVRLGLALTTVAFTPDGKRMITDGEGLGEIWAVDDATPRYIGDLSGGPEQVTGVALSPDGKMALVEDVGRGIDLWRMNNAKSVRALATLPVDKAGVSGISFPTTATASMAVAAADGSITLWNVTDLHRPVKSRSTAPVHSNRAPYSAIGDPDTRFSPDGNRIADGDERAIVVSRINTDGEIRHTGTVHDPAGGRIKPLAVSPDGTLLTTDPDRKDALPMLFDTDGTAQLLGRLPVHTEDAAFARDGRTLITRGADRTLTWWDVTTPSHPQRIAQSSARSGAKTGPVVYSNDGKLTIATESGAPGTLLRTTDRTKPIVIGTRPGLSGGVAGDAILAGRLLVLSTLGLVRLWDVTDPSDAVLLAEFDTGDDSGVVNGRGALSPSGVLAASQLGRPPAAYKSGVATVRLWDLAEIREIVENPISVACQHAGSEPTADLWRQYAPELRPRPLCG
jgi:WD40 repeat protein